MKRIVALLVVIGALVGASTASASKIQLYNQCQWTSSSLHTSGGVAGNQTVTNPVWISFGWGAQKVSQVQQFLASQYGTISITTSTGTPVYSTSWTQGGSGDGTWSPIAPRQLQDRRGTVVNGYATDWRSPNLILPTGQYTLSLDLGLAQGVNDGYGAASPGSWLNITACSFTVQ